jgi:hypothetical protein
MAGEFKIGPHRFLSLDGVPPVRARQGEIVVRPGVDGLSFWIHGTRGVPFTVRSRVDYESKAAAMAKRVEYSQLVLAGRQVLVWGDYPLTSDGDDARVMVLDVRPVFGGCGELLLSSGGLNPPSLGYLECDWDLVVC